MTAVERTPAWLLLAALLLWGLPLRAEEGSFPLLSHLAALQDPNPEVRASACEALATPRARGAVRSLARVLREDPEPAIRASAAFALAKIRAPEAVPALVAAAREEDRYTGADRERAWALDAVPMSPRDAACLALAGAGREGLGGLAALLDRPEREVRAAAAWALQYAAPEEPSASSLSPHSPLRFGEARHRAAFFALVVRALRDPEPQVRLGGLEVVGWVRVNPLPPSELRALTRATLRAWRSDPRGSHGRAAEHALSELGRVLASAGEPAPLLLLEVWAGELLGLLLALGAWFGAARRLMRDRSTRWRVLQVGAIGAPPWAGLVFVQNVVASEPWVKLYLPAPGIALVPTDVAVFATISFACLLAAGWATLPRPAPDPDGPAAAGGTS